MKFHSSIFYLYVYWSLFNVLSRRTSIRKIIIIKKSLMILNDSKVKFKKKFASKFGNKIQKKMDDFTWTPCINI